MIIPACDAPISITERVGWVYSRQRWIASWQSWTSVFDILPNNLSIEAIIIKI